MRGRTECDFEVACGSDDLTWSQVGGEPIEAVVIDARSAFAALEVVLAGDALVPTGAFRSKVQGSVHTDPTVPLARVRVEEDERLGHVFVFHPDAYQVLAYYGMIADVLDHVEPRGAGEYVIPRSVIDREQAEDVERQIEYMTDLGMAESEDKGGQCALPTCIQDGVDRKRGFLVCSGHAELLQGWDDLVEAPL